MRNLLRLVYRYHSIFIFLLLEVIALFLLVQNNRHQQAHFLNSANGIIGSLYETRASVTDYINLKSTNEQLAKENALFRSMQRSSFIQLNSNYTVVNDTIFRQQYAYINAEVINHSTNKQNNYLTLNKGTIHGIRADMGVVCPDGIVGFVKFASTHYSTVVPVVNVQNFTAPVVTQKNNYPGLLKWEGHDPEMAKVIDIAKHARVVPGDTIITSPSSGIYPKNILVGIVKTAEVEAGSDAYIVDLQLATNFHNLKHVYVVSNLLKQEQHQLEQQTVSADAQ